MASLFGRNRRQPITSEATSPSVPGGGLGHGSTYESIGPSTSSASLSAPYNFFAALSRATTRTHTNSGGLNTGGSRETGGSLGGNFGETYEDERQGGGDSDEETLVWTGLGGTISCEGLGRGLILGLVMWAVLASIAAFTFSWRAASRVNANGNFLADDQQREGRNNERNQSSTSMEAAAVDVSSPNSWYLPNAVRQSFSGLVLTESNEFMPSGRWEGDHWWYHDEITNCLHILASMGGVTYGFWEAGIISTSGTTDYITAAYKDGECLYYQEEMEVGEPFEDVMCRASAWVGNVSAQGNVEYGYGMKAERWRGHVPEGHNSGEWGLPPGTESLIDFQRDPTNENEVRLLYHKVVAPTEGVLAWAGGDSVAFDFVFTDAKGMSAAEVQALVKVPKECEVKAGEFHDQQARDHNLAAGGGRRARRRTTRETTAETKPTASDMSPRESIKLPTDQAGTTEKRQIAKGWGRADVGAMGR